MEAELLDANVVVVAGRVNPSIFKSHWLLREKILFESELPEHGAVYTDQVAFIPAKDFSLTVMEQQIQLAFQKNIIESEQAAGLAERVIGITVEVLKHTPWSAVGVNFSWYLATAQHDEFVRLGRNMWGECSTPLMIEFEAPSAVRGAYLSKIIEDGVRLKLDIKPTQRRDNPSQGTVEGMMLSYNYHADIRPDDESQTGDAPAKIQAHLAKWTKFFRHSQSINQLVVSAGEA